MSLLDEAAKIVTSRLGDRFRVAGTAEFNGFNLDIRAERIQPLVDWTRRHFPGVRTARVVPWCGLRPMMPDMMPRVGPGKRPGVFYNTGHGHLGWTLSAATAQMLAASVREGSDCRKAIAAEHRPGAGRTRTGPQYPSSCGTEEASNVSPEQVSSPSTRRRNATSEMPMYRRVPSSVGISMAGATTANMGAMSRVTMPVAVGGHGHGQHRQVEILDHGALRVLAETAQRAPEGRHAAGEAADAAHHAAHQSDRAVPSDCRRCAASAAPSA